MPGVHLPGVQRLCRDHRHAPAAARRGASLWLTGGRTGPAGLGRGIVDASRRASLPPGRGTASRWFTPNGKPPTGGDPTAALSTSARRSPAWIPSDDRLAPPLEPIPGHPLVAVRHRHRPIGFAFSISPLHIGVETLLLGCSPLRRSLAYVLGWTLANVPVVTLLLPVNHPGLQADGEITGLYPLWAGSLLLPPLARVLSSGTIRAHRSCASRNSCSAARVGWLVGVLA